MGAPDDDDRSWLELEIERAMLRAPFRPEASERHMAASFRFGWPELHQLSDFSTSALVIHGSADRVLPTGHARSLAAGINDSDLHVIDGMGHLPTRSEWDRITQLTAAQFARRGAG